MTPPAIALPPPRPGLRRRAARAAGRLALSIAVLGGAPLLAQAAGPLDGLPSGMPRTPPAAAGNAVLVAAATPADAGAAAQGNSMAALPASVNVAAASGNSVATHPAGAGAATAQNADHLAPAEAQRALQVLQDDAARAQAIRALKAIADTAPAAAGNAQTPPAAASSGAAPSTSAAAPAAPAAPAAAPGPDASTTTIVPLEANGLMARMLRSISNWVDGVGAQMAQIRAGMQAIPEMVARANRGLATEAGQKLLRQMATTLVAVFVVALLLEWALQRALRQPRTALALHADEEEAAERRQRREEEQRAQAERQRQTADRAQSRDRQDAEDASLRGAPPGVALVQTTRDGISRVEAVPVPIEDGATPPDATQPDAADSPPAADGNTTAGKTMAAAAGATAGSTTRAAAGVAAGSTPGTTPGAAADLAAGTAPGAAAGSTTGATPGAAAGAGAQAAPGGMAATGSDTVAVGMAAGATGAIARDAALPRGTAAGPAARQAASNEATRYAGRHWRTIRHLPYVLASLVLDLLPLAVFFIAAGLMLRWLDGDDPRVHDAVAGFVHAYVTTRISMAVLRLLLSPVGHGLRLLHLADAVSQKLLSGLRRIIVLALFGLAVADAAQILGVGAQARLILLKGISLVVHLFAIALILQLRRPVARILAGKPEQKGPLAMARHWLARTWAVIAIVLVAGIWIVWALGVEDGFPKLMHFVVVTGGVIIAARVVAMLLLGALGRLFQPHADDAEGKDETSRSAAQERLAGRYFPVVRGLVTVLIVVATAFALLQAWGADVSDWFARGTLGRSMASALATIAASIVIAVLVWEAVHYAIERRLQRWKEEGDTLRAARLRTLLPMLRTLLLIAVILVVGLTALNEIGVNTTPLLAGASIIGVAVGFGSQKLVQDFITGIFLLMENAMQVGDWVTVAGVSGSVEYLSIRTVRLRGGDGSLYIVPFSSVSTVNNTNRGLGNAAVRVSVAYDTNVEQVIAELKKLGAEMRADPAYSNVILNDIEVWGVDAVDGSMVTVAGQIRCKDSGRWGVQREMNRRILDRFRDLDIAIANPRASLLLTADETPAEMPAPPAAPARTEPRKAPPQA